MLAFALVSLGGPPRARADEAQARQHFKRGVELYDRKEYKEAEKAFRDAYREKPSAGIKQNIALSLKGQGDLVAAATMLDEALDEGRATLKPETRAAIERELAELSKQVATVLIRVVTADEKRPLEGATVLVDGQPRVWRRPIRLSPSGIHVFRAHADGYPDPPEKKLAPTAGSPVDATFEIASGVGMVTVRPSVEGAAIRVDGVEVGRGVWTGQLSPGAHRVEVSAPDFDAAVVDLTVTPGATVDYPITLHKPSDAPPPYVAPPAPPPQKPKTFYFAPMLAPQWGSYRLGPGLGEPSDGRRRQLAGLGLGLKGGIRLSRFLAPELHVEVGSLSASYKLRSSDSVESETLLTHWQITPAIRFTSPGKIRFTSGTGVGVHGVAVEGKLADTNGNVTRKGRGVAFSWLVDAGFQADAGPVFFEGVLFFDVHGVGTAREDTSGDRLLQSSPATRIGLRIGLGIPF